jgi:hypothetical protein
VWVLTDPPIWGWKSPLSPSARVDTATFIFNGKDYKLLKSVKFMDDADFVCYHPQTNLDHVAHAENSLGVIDAKIFEVKK